MKYSQAAARRFLAIALLLFLGACSYEKTSALSVRMSGRAPTTVIKAIQQIAESLGYHEGAIRSNDGAAVAVLEEETRYRFYLINEELRTSIRAEVPKTDTATKVVFAEFGIEEFSRRGKEQIQLLTESLVTAFGQESVAILNSDNIGL